MLGVPRADHAWRVPLGLAKKVPRFYRVSVLKFANRSVLVFCVSDCLCRSYVLVFWESRSGHANRFGVR